MWVPPFYFLQNRARTLMAELSQLLQQYGPPPAPSLPQATPPAFPSLPQATPPAFPSLPQAYPPAFPSLPQATPPAFPSFPSLHQLNRPDTVRAGLGRLFQPYKKKKKDFAQPWGHRFFCCASTVQIQIPTVEETSSLQAAGLGTKQVIFPDVRCTSGQFIAVLEDVFPPLKLAGGFKIMRSCRSRDLIDIPMPAGGYTVSFLKNNSSLNKAVAYIVPMQHNITLKEVENVRNTL